MMIDVAREFSPYPSGRVEKDGPFHGEKFRREYLVPKLLQIVNHEVPDDELIVDIDGVRSFGSSFLEEAFGGLFREGLAGLQVADKVIRIKCTQPRLQMFRDAILEHMRDAKIAAAAN